MKTSKGKFILKIYEDASLNFIKEQIRLMEFLKKTKVSSPKIINTKNKNGLLIYKKKRLAIQEFVEGNEVSHINKELTKDIAKKFGLLSKILLKYDGTGDKKWIKDHQFKLFRRKNYNVKGIDLKEETHKLLLEMKGLDKNKLKKSVVHADLCDSNLLAQNNKLTAIIDWDDFHIDYLVFDMAVFVGQVLVTKKEVKQDLIKLFLKEYQKQIKLNNEEKKALYYFARKRLLDAAIWCINLVSKHKGKEKELIEWAEGAIDEYFLLDKLSLKGFLKLC